MTAPQRPDPSSWPGHSEPASADPSSQPQALDPRQLASAGLDDPPSRLRPRHVPWLAALLALLVLAGALGWAQFSRQHQQDTALARAALHAKVLEDQLSRSLQGAETVLRHLADSLSDQAERPAATPADEQGALPRLQGLLADSLRHQPLLRSLWLLDAQGRVLLSTQAETVGQRLPDAAFTPLLAPTPPSPSPLKPNDQPITRPVADAALTRLGALRAGRELGELQAPRPVASVAYSLPMERSVASPGGGAPLRLVALLNPDHLATEQQRLLNDTGLQAAVLGLDGSLIAGPADLLPGEAHVQLPPFSQFLPAHQQGSYLGAGLLTRDAVVAFRAARRWPVLVLVEQASSDLAADTQATWRRLALACLLLWAVIGLGSALLWRGLRRDEANRRRLKALRASARMLELRRRAILDASMDGILTFDAQGTLVDFNPAAELIFGRNRADVLGQTFFTLLPPSARARVRAGLFDYLDGRAGGLVNQRVELDALHAKGGTFPIEVTLVPVRAGRQLYFTGTLRDITTRREIEADRNALLARYQALATDLERQKLALDAHAVVSITDPFGRITYANAKLAELSGYAPTELLGHKHSLLKSGQHGPEVYQQLWHTIARGGIWHGELVNRRKDGALYWVAGTIVPVPGEDGRPRQYISIQTDISALRRAELALAQAHRRELEIGARIQQSLLVTPPESPGQGLWLSASNQASQGIDGDFVEAFQLGPHCLDLVVGDVMGKGLAAALMGAATKLQFSRSLAELLARHAGQRPEPAQIVAAVHAAMTPHLQALEAFVTLCHVRIDTQANTLTWVGCGHEEPVVLQGGKRLLNLHNQHPPLGVLDQTDYQQEHISFLPGDALFLCSDGMADALRPDGERVGRERSAQAFAQLARRHSTPAAVLHRLRQVLLHEQVHITDDVTLVMAQRVATQPVVERLELPAQLDMLRPLRSFVARHAQAAGLGEDASGLLQVATVEAFTNIIRHANDRPPDAPIEVLASPSESGLTLDLVHLGAAFTPAGTAGVDTDFSVFPEGGFGLNIIRSACDEVQYLHTAGVNTVRLFRRRG